MPDRLTPDPVVLAALLERVRAATGSDRELDAEIWWLFADHRDTNRAVMGWAEKRGVAYALAKFAGSTWRTQPWLIAYTASLDAALKLVEHVLPDACTDVVVNAHREGGGRVSLAHISVGDADLGACWEATSGPLAVCEALLTALLHQSEAAHA